MFCSQFLYDYATNSRLAHYLHLVGPSVVVAVVAPAASASTAAGHVGPVLHVPETHSKHKQLVTPQHNKYINRSLGIKGKYMKERYNKTDTNTNAKGELKYRVNSCIQNISHSYFKLRIRFCFPCKYSISHLKCKGNDYITLPPWWWHILFVDDSRWLHFSIVMTKQLKNKWIN